MPEESPKERAPQRVVIVGASFAGRRVHALLSQDPRFQVQVIDASPYFEYTPSILRCLVEPGHARTILVPHPPCVHVAQAVDIDTTTRTLTLSDGTSLTCDHLVLATGSGYASPIKQRFMPNRELQDGPGDRPSAKADALSRRVEELHSAAAELKRAQSVVVVGGGEVGVELAAEVTGHYKATKRVTLISGNKRLLPHLGTRASVKAQQWLTAAGVEVVLGERVSSWPQGAQSQAVAGTVVTSGGKPFTADLVYNCTGSIACGLNVDLYGSLIKGTPGAEEAVAKARHDGIPVSETLQVQGFPWVWACGDVAATQFTRCAMASDQMAEAVVNNLRRLTDGKDLLPFPQASMPSAPGLTTLPRAAVVSLYKYDAIMQAHGLTITGYLAAFSKAQLERILLGIMKGNRAYLALLRTSEWVMAQSTPLLQAVIPGLA